LEWEEKTVRNTSVGRNNMIEVPKQYEVYPAHANNLINEMSWRWSFYMGIGSLSIKNLSQMVLINTEFTPINPIDLIEVKIL
jgi:hypothetical protein